jgi:fucose permease
MIAPDNRRAVQSASIAFLSFAAPIAMLGVIWPDVRERFDQSLGALGIASLVYGLGRALMALNGPTLARWFGMGRAFVVVLILLAFAVMSMALSTTWPMFLISLACVGLASGTLDSLGAGFITAIRDVGSSGLVHGAYGVGATLGPLIVIAVSSWRLALGLSGVIVIAAALVALRSQRAWPGITPHVRKTGSRPPFTPAALSLGAFCAFVGMEVTTGQWAFTQLTEGRNAGDTPAAIAVALFWGGLAVGRLALVRPSARDLADRVGLSRLALVSLCCLASLAFTPPGFAVVGLAFSGLTLAPIVPTLFASTAARVGADHAQRLAVFQLLATNLGGIGLPFLTGQLVDAMQPSVIVMVIVTAAAIGTLLLGAIERLPILTNVGPSHVPRLPRP